MFEEFKFIENDFFFQFLNNFNKNFTFTPLNPLTKRLLIPKVLKSDFLPSKISIFMTLSQQHVNNNFFLIKSLTQTCFKLIHIPKIRKWENIFSWLSFISFCHNIKKKKVFGISFAVIKKPLKHQKWKFKFWKSFHFKMCL